jgi:CBS-domain-containing membrane protein
MTLQEQLEQAKARRNEMFAGRPRVYRAWEDTWTAFHEDSTAYNKAHARLLEYDIAKNKVVDEVKRLRMLVEDPDITASRAEIKAFTQTLRRRHDPAKL